MSASPCLIACDLGTGGNKTVLYTIDGAEMATAFNPYKTHYPAAGYHEQSPEDWWQAIVMSVRKVLSQTDIAHDRVDTLALSGQSLAMVPLDARGHLLRPRVPIWSDSRAGTQADRFFEHVPEQAWYQQTGNGFPAALYTVFKIMWLRDNEPAVLDATRWVLGSKDYINYRLTGEIATDPSYASGSGVFDLATLGYGDDLIKAAEIQEQLLAPVVPSASVIGTLTTEAASALGLHQGVKVVAGGVDNACMALGARNTQEGRIYNSLGSSSWIAVSSSRPVLDFACRPFVFAHVVPGLFTSATSIFSAGSSFRWVRDQLCPDLIADAKRTGRDPYELMTEIAAESPPGANNLLFNPSLGGGTPIDKSTGIRGAYFGIDLRHTRADLIRAAMEGVAMGLRRAMDVLQRLTTTSDEVLIVGGGSRSALWRQILADVLNMSVVKTNIDQQAAALGAVALAAVGGGHWSDFSPIEEIHHVQSVATPTAQNRVLYERLFPAFEKAGDLAADLGDMLTQEPHPV